MPRDINDSIKKLPQNRGNSALDKYLSPGFKAPTTQFIAPQRNVADAYLSYLSGVSDPNKLKQLKTDNTALRGTQVWSGGDASNVAGLLTGTDAFGRDRQQYYSMYVEMDKQLAQYDVKKEAQDAVVEQKKAEVAQTNVANAQTSAAQRRRGGGTATPRSGLLGLPIVDFQQAMSRKYGI